MERCDCEKSSSDGRSICDAQFAFAISADLDLVGDGEAPTIDG